MKRIVISGRKSFHEAEVGRHGVSYCTKLEASMDGTRLVVAIGPLGCVISSGVVSIITRVNGGRMSSRNEGTH